MNIKIVETYETYQNNVDTFLCLSGDSNNKTSVQYLTMLVRNIAEDEFHHLPKLSSPGIVESKLNPLDIHDQLCQQFGVVRRLDGVVKGHEVENKAEEKDYREHHQHVLPG